MAKKMYAGIDNKARKIKKLYGGIDGKARKIRKGYAGVGGVARPFWTGGQLAYFGNSSDGAIEPLSVPLHGMFSVSIKKYALFGGGSNGNNTSAVVNAFDKNLTRILPVGLPEANRELSAAKAGEYALIGLGYFTSKVYVYDENLTLSYAEPISTPRCGGAATTVGQYALFGGGGNNAVGSSAVDAYDENLTHTTPTELSVRRGALAATTIKNHALFGGGYGQVSSSFYCYNTVDAYDENLTRTTPSVLSAIRMYLAATTVGGHALFGGGERDSTPSSVVDAYDENLVRTTPAELSQARTRLAATAVGGYGLFGGGDKQISFSFPYDFTPYSVVDIYDENLTRTMAAELSEARYNLAATTLGDYALFGGGNKSATSTLVSSAVMDIYTV